MAQLLISVVQYLLKVGATTIVQLVILLGPGLALALIMDRLSDVLRARAEALLGERFWVYYTAVGVAIHEIGHALFALLFGHEVTDIKFFKVDRASGTLGSVSHTYNSKDMYQLVGNFFIGIAPILMGTLVIYVSSVCLLGSDFVSPLQQIQVEPAALSSPGSMWLAAREITGRTIEVFRSLANAHNLLNWRFYAFLYVVLAVGSQVTLSPADISVALRGFRVVVGLVFILNLAFLWTGDFATRSAMLLSQSYSFFYAYMVFSIILNAALVLLFTAIALARGVARRREYLGSSLSALRIADLFPQRSVRRRARRAANRLFRPAATRWQQRSRHSRPSRTGLMLAAGAVAAFAMAIVWLRAGNIGLVRPMAQVGHADSQREPASADSTPARAEAPLASPSASATGARRLASRSATPTQALAGASPAATRLSSLLASITPIAPIRLIVGSPLRLLPSANDLPPNMMFWKQEEISNEDIAGFYPPYEEHLETVRHWGRETSFVHYYVHVQDCQSKGLKEIRVQAAVYDSVWGVTQSFEWARARDEASAVDVYAASGVGDDAYGAIYNDPNTCSGASTLRRVSVVFRRANILGTVDALTVPENMSNATLWESAMGVARVLDSKIVAEAH